LKLWFLSFVEWAISSAHADDFSVSFKGGNYKGETRKGKRGQVYAIDKMIFSDNL